MAPAIPFLPFQTPASGCLWKHCRTPGCAHGFLVPASVAHCSQQTGSRPTLDLGGQPLMSKRGGISFAKEGGISLSTGGTCVYTVLGPIRLAAAHSTTEKIFVALSSQWEGMVVEAERDAERATAAILQRYALDSTDSGKGTLSHGEEC